MYHQFQSALDQNEDLDALVHYLTALDLHIQPKELDMEVEELPEPLNSQEVLDVAHHIHTNHREINFIKGVCEARDQADGAQVERVREAVFGKYKETVFSGHTTGNPPKERGFW